MNYEITQGQEERQEEGQNSGNLGTIYNIIVATQISCL